MDLPDEDELPVMAAHHIDATTGQDELDEDGQLLIDMEQQVKATARGKPAINPQDPKTWGKVARNDLCPCGSGRRYKHCHGAFA